MTDQRPDQASITGSPTLDTGRLPAADAPLPASIGGFRILGKLGEGGMGIVYEAEQQSPKRRVALKVIRGGQFVDEQYLRMFRRETETLARLAHPNIAAIYEAGRTDDGQHFFTMELVSGPTLAAFVWEKLGGASPTPEQVRERLRIVGKICRGVTYAHQRGVIHRDLKPSNLVLDGSGEVKILDFGLARITDTDVAAATTMSDVGAIRGTLPYMSPEQARGDSLAIDLRTDVYSLGVILYELLAGRHPYDTSKQSIVQAIRTICEVQPRPLDSLSGGRPVDADLRTITAKALEKEPDRRYQSATALADDVERYLANQPILAHPPSTMYQLRKLVSRHRVGVAATAAIAMLLVALGVTMAVQAQRVRSERDRATAEAAKAGAINTFLLDALGAADPWDKGSRNVTLLDALRQAQGKAHAAFGGQPLVEASVLQTIGTTLGSLAESEAAEKALRTALDLRVAAAGSGSPEAAQTWDALAAMYIRWGKYDDAEASARKAVGLFEDGSLEGAAAMTQLATALSKKARYTEARSVVQKVLSIARAHHPAAGATTPANRDPAVIEIHALTVLGESALDEGDYKEMESVERERMTLARARYPAQHPELAQALNDFGSAQMMSGDLAGAERSYLEAIAIGRAALGDDHPELALYRENLGNAYFRSGRLDETSRLLEDVLKARRRALGDESEPVARTLANMGSVYMRIGKNEVAERSFREAVARLTRHLGPEHPDVASTLANLGETLRREKKLAESETTLRRALELQVKAQGEAGPPAQRTIKCLVNLYTDLQKPALAATYQAKLKTVTGTK